MKKVFLLLFLWVAVSGCVWDDEETLYPQPDTCDTLDVTFSLDVVPLMANKCYSCHSNVNAPDFASGIALEDYADVKASSYLIVGAINHSSGFPAMPLNAEKLDTCSIQTIEAWVNAGSPDN